MTDYFVSAGDGTPAVVVAHDWYGLLPHVRALCDDLARAGLSALAVDLYEARSTTDEAEAEELMGSLDGAAAKERLADAVRNLRRADIMAPRVSAIGFSMGGQIVLDAATAGLFDAVVAYYASLTPAQDAMPCPVLLHLAGVVDFDPPDLPQQFVTAVRAAGGSAADHVYPGTEHSFANADAAYFQAEATQTAWGRTLTFLGA